MANCPYCNKRLTPGVKFCRGHNIAYKNRLLAQYRIDSSEDIKQELIKYGWFEFTISTKSREEITYKFRKFGVELETISNEESQVESAMNLAESLGVELETTTHNPRLSRKWKVMPDSSLHRGIGREFVSPPFTDESRAFLEIQHVCSAINFNNISVNSSCGFHIHFDISDLIPREIARVMKFYQVYEQEIDEMHSPSRRRSVSTYCGSLVSYNFNPESITTIDELTSIFSSRYLKVNIQAYLRHGTLEFRQHSGTVNSIKIIYWYKFCCKVIEYAKTCNPIDASVPLQTALNFTTDEKTYWNSRIAKLRRGA